MAPAAILKVKPGQKVLDLCAAPGGKSTELGARLLGKGLLVANDISASRAKALLKNLEMAGIGNVCVTA
jgi:16S rRNA C967 or C1407 C5-methylase (RsmB/RsmF family)